MSESRLHNLLLALVLFAMSACGNQAPSAATPTERVLKVELAVAELASVETKLDAVGSVRASEEAMIRPQVDGVIAEIAYDQGATVKTGDLLVRLDDAKADARLSLARASSDNAHAKLKLAEQRLARGRTLIAENLVSQEAFDQVESEFLAAEADVREAQASVSLAERELADYYIRAPFDGVVGAKLVDLGNFVQNGDALVFLMKTDPVEVEFKVPDQFMHRLRVGNEATVSSTSGGAPATARITFIDPRVDPTTRMLNLLATIDNLDDRFKPGQFVKVEAVVETRDAQVVIPEEALLLAVGQTWVFVVEDGRALKRAVTVGERTPGKVEILDGIREGEQLVVGGQHRLVEGSHVEAAAGISPGA